MEKDRMPRPGEIYNHFKDKPYQIITVATHTETGEQMVVYQALYGDFKTFIRPLDMFLSEVDKEKYPNATQKYRFEHRKDNAGNEPGTSYTGKDAAAGASAVTTGDSSIKASDKETAAKPKISTPEADSMKQFIGHPGTNSEAEVSDGNISSVLIKFLDAESYNKKLEVITTNMKHLNDRLINDMAVSLDCTVDEGPIDKRIQELIFCLQAMRRFEDRRLR